MYNRKKDNHQYNKIKTIEDESVWMIASRMENDRWIMLKYGNEINIAKAYDHMVKAYSEAGFQDEVDDLYILDTTDFSEHDICMCLDSTNYISRLINADIFWKKQKEELCIVIK